VERQNCDERQIYTRCLALQERNRKMAIYDFHTHTTLSDGGLLPVELIRRAHVKGYKAIGVTDHAGAGTMERVIRGVRADCKLACRAWGIHAFAGVELTHVPAADIAALARKAKELGAQIVVVHGETPVEPVEPGTDRAALLSPDVDVLAHPGFITEEEAALAKRNGIFIDIGEARPLPDKRACGEDGAAHRRLDACQLRCARPWRPARHRNGQKSGARSRPQRG